MAVELGSARVLHPGKLRWLRTIGWMIALFIGLALLQALGEFGLRYAIAVGEGVPFVKGGAGLPLPEKLAAGLVSLALMLGGYWAAVRYGEARRLSEMDTARMVPEVLAGLAIGVTIMAVTVGMLWAFGFVSITEQPTRSVVGALRFTAQSAVAEELLLRAVVLRLLWRAFGAWWAIGLSALLFGALHLANPNASLFAALCIALEAGTMLGAFYMLTGRVWLSIGLHAGWNFTQGWIFGAAVSGTDLFAGGPLVTRPNQGVPEFLSGGHFGPEASLPALILCTALGCAVLWRAWARGQFNPAPDQQIAAA